jgi:prephenate dehydrogenase
LNAIEGPVGVVGLGAVGGSLARALAALPEPPALRGSSRSEADVRAACEAGLLERPCADAAEVAAGVRCLVIAVPLAATEGVLREASATLPADALVLDVGSLQGPPLAEAGRVGLAARFVACHPMAGTEASGFAAARADLFVDAPVWLSTGLDAADGVASAAEVFWRALGARPAWIEPEDHDARMVVASHLPQLVANALARVLEQGGLVPGDLGPGGSDMTRLAGSDPDMWRGLLAHSGPQAAALLRLLGRELDGWARALDAQDLDEIVRLMDETRRWRTS